MKKRSGLIMCNRTFKYTIMNQTGKPTKSGLASSVVPKKSPLLRAGEKVDYISGRCELTFPPGEAVSADSLRFRRTCGQASFPTVQSVAADKKKPAFQAGSQGISDQYCCCHGAGCLPVPQPQPVKTRAYLQKAVDGNVLSHRKDLPRKYFTCY